MVQCIQEFVKCCYIARCNAITASDLNAFNQHLEQIYQLHNLFIETGVCASISLFCQHALMHYSSKVERFASPNGVCSLIIESTHINAVKEPWQCSNQNDPLPQMVWTISWLHKLDALCHVFENCSMLDRKLSNYTWVFISGNLPPIHHYGAQKDKEEDDDEEDYNDRGPSPGAFANAQVTLAVMKGEYQNTVIRLQNWEPSCAERNYPRDLQQLATCINQPGFPNALQWFVFHQWQPNTQNLPVNLPEFSLSIHVFHSATVTFYALSDMCGAGGMYREHIWANKQWKGKPQHHTVFVKVTNEEDDEAEEGSKLEIIHGMLIACVLLFFTFHDPVLCEEVPCALVNWFMLVSNQWDGWWACGSSNSRWWVCDPHWKLYTSTALFEGLICCPTMGEDFFLKILMLHQLWMPAGPTSSTISLTTMGMSYYKTIESSLSLWTLWTFSTFEALWDAPQAFSII